MIEVAIFTHESVIDNSIFFDETDLRIVSIKDNEVVTKKDFDELWEVIKEIDTKNLKGGVWYKLKFKREWEYGGEYPYDPRLVWFELVQLTLIG